MQWSLLKLGRSERLSVVASGMWLSYLPLASVQEMQLLKDKGCTIVDTTCPWVSKVWNTVEKHKRRLYLNYSANHEETIATSSFAAKYLVVLNLAEAEYVADYILNGGDRNEFMAKPRLLRWVRSRPRLRADWYC